MAVSKRKGPDPIEDSRLGMLTFEVDSWKYKLGDWRHVRSMPAFAAFDYYDRFVVEPQERPADSVRFILESEGGEFGRPPAEVILDVATLFVANHEQLLKDCIGALWDEFNGDRPNTMMWWWDDIDHVHEILDGSFDAKHRRITLRKPGKPASELLSNASDLSHFLHSPRVVCSSSAYGYPKPNAKLVFESPIEVEHGIGFLTDGQQLLGVGYEMDVAPLGT